MTGNLKADAPEISVICAVYNGETDLDECLRSIREQTFANFEFLVVDDGSTDGTAEILRRHAAEDARIRVLTNERNKERSVSRNTALARARADLIAVIDADDIALPDRLEQQFAFMKANPDVLVLGGAYVYHETGETVRCPADDAAIRAMLLWHSPFAHPAVMYRRAPVLEAGAYDPALPLCEDYDLWSRLALLPGWRFANLDDALLRYRLHPQADRRAYHARQRNCSLRVVKAHMRRLGIPEAAVDMEAHLQLFRGEAHAVAPQRLEAWAAWLMAWNRRARVFAPEFFDNVCLARVGEARVSRLNAACARGLPASVKRLLPSAVKKLCKKMLGLQNRLRLRRLASGK